MSIGKNDFSYIMRKKIADREQITNRIRKLRRAENQRKFAEKLGIPVTTLASIEKGSLPGPDFLILISQKTGVSIDYLLTGLSKNATDKVQEEENIYFTAGDRTMQRLLKYIKDFTPDELEDLLGYIKLLKKRRR